MTYACPHEIENLGQRHICTSPSAPLSAEVYSEAPPHSHHTHTPFHTHIPQCYPAFTALAGKFPEHKAAFDELATLFLKDVDDARSTAAAAAAKAAAAAVVGKAPSAAPPGPAAPLGPAATAADQSLCTVASQSFLAPRGRFDMEWHATKLMLRNKKGETFECAYADVSNIFALHESDASGRTTGYLWALHMRTPVQLSKTRKSNLFVMQVKATAKNCKFDDWTVNVGGVGGAGVGGVGVEAGGAVVKSEAGSGGGKRVAGGGARVLTGDPMVVLKELGSTLAKTNATCPDDRIFRGATAGKAAGGGTGGAAGGASVKCFHGVDDGILFPLSNGLFFARKPLMFIPLEDMTAIEFGRHGSGNLRTFDLFVQVRRREAG